MLKVIYPNAKIISGEKRKNVPNSKICDAFCRSLDFFVSDHSTNP
jgi:hypothetical protein